MRVHPERGAGGAEHLLAAGLRGVVGVGAQEAVRQRKAAGDAQVYFVPVNEDGPLLSEDDFAQDWTHPVYTGAVKVAEHIRDRVAAILGWIEPEHVGA